MDPMSRRGMSHSPIPSTSYSTRRPPPPPIYTPKRIHVLPDRTSVSSSTSASTSSTRDTLLLISPTTPTKGQWYDDPTSLVSEYLAPPAEGIDEWDASTPTHGKFQQAQETFEDFGMIQKGNTKSWWAGTTPTARRKTIEVETQSTHAPDAGDYDDAALGESPTLGRRSLISIWDELRAETGSFHESLYPETEQGKEQHDLFSPVPRNTPSAMEDSPTIPVDILPAVPRISAPKREVPAVSLVNQFMLGDGEWTAKRLGKLREERYTQLGLFGGIDGLDHQGPSYPSTSHIHDSSSSSVSIPSSSSSIKSTSTRKSVKSQAQPPLAIPKRSSSKRLSLVYPAVNPRQPPRPPARGSSLQTVILPSIASSSSLSSYSSSASSSTGRSVRFNEQRSVSTPVRNASLTNLVPVASASTRPVKRRTTTSSSFSTLETVLEAPRDLDVSPDPAWALRDPPASYRLRGLQSRSQPDLHDHIPGTMMQKLRMKRIASAASFGEKGDRRKSFGTLSALTMLASEDTKPRNDKEGFMRTFTLRRSEQLRAASRALPAEWKHTDPSHHTTVGRLDESHDAPPRVELAFVPSRPAPAPPLNVSDFDGCEEIHGEWYQSTIRAISLEASRAMRDAESWTWPHPPTRSPSIINTSESGSSLGGPITPSSASFVQMDKFENQTTEDTPTQRQKREGEYGLDLLHGEEEFEEGQRKRMSMRISVQDEMEVSRKQNRLSLAPAWSGGME